MMFLWKTPETKMLPEIFCEAFLIFNKIICCSCPGVISVVQKDSFHPTAMRIRV
jgi:hypothetical protein